MRDKFIALLSALLMVAGLVVAASPASATTVCGGELSESRSASNGDMTVTVTAYWRNCTINGTIHKEDPTRGQIASVWDGGGSPNCNGVFGGFVKINYQMTVQDNAPRTYSISGSMNCEADGFIWREFSLAGSLMLSPSLNSRWSSHFTAVYNNFPDSSFTVYGDF
jgi:hypothetical protein